MLQRERLRELLDAKRFEHSLRTSNTAVRLANLYGAHREKAALAGLLHDCARNLPVQQLWTLAQQLKLPLGEIEQKLPVLLHAPVGAAMAQWEFGINELDIHRAITLHTLGDENMSLLDKIIYIADKIEPGRVFPGVENLRKLALQDLDQALLGCFDASIQFSLFNTKLIHPTTIKARNRLLLCSG